MRELCCSTWAMTELTVPRHDPTCHVTEIARLRAEVELRDKHATLLKGNIFHLTAEVERLTRERDDSNAQLALAMLALEHATEVDEKHHYAQWWKKWAEPIVNGETTAHERAGALLAVVQAAEDLYGSAVPFARGKTIQAEYPVLSANLAVLLAELENKITAYRGRT